MGLRGLTVRSEDCVRKVVRGTDGELQAEHPETQPEGESRLAAGDQGNRDRGGGVKDGRERMYDS